ncbi:hypothetical protein [Pseudotabrizicola formosa]|uniref:hypothetical protein n=1 Tax=Pseudotabrizicola formosa TaxID=2030009 RepID=UPI0011AF8414|nr:hypothetical protein [Pseudotabrizicola formosa]
MIMAPLAVAETHPDDGIDPDGLLPPVAPLAMPKQILTREAGPLWRGLGMVLALLRRDMGRVG